jgi:hypothetical protein
VSDTTARPNHLGCGHFPLTHEMFNFGMGMAYPW